MKPILLENVVKSNHYFRKFNNLEQELIQKFSSESCLLRFLQREVSGDMVLVEPDLIIVYWSVSGIVVEDLCLFTWVETYRAAFQHWFHSLVVTDALLQQLRNSDKYRVFQKDLNIFYSGHRGHRTWHPVIFSYGDTLKTMPANHHSPKMCVNCKIAFELRCKPLMGTCWSASGRRDYRIDICRVTKGAHKEHLWADFGKLGHLHYLCVKLYLILTINT